MAKSTSERHYEEKFEFPLWKLIQHRAKEKDISYLKAAQEVTPEYCKNIRYRDEEWEDEIVAERGKELEELRKRYENE